MKEEVVIQVPATTANLGPGFDSLGIALSIHNRVALRRKSGSIVDGMIEEAARAFFEASGQKSFEFSCSITGDVPQSRGLGSSVTVRLGVLIGLNSLAQASLSTENLYRICAKLEGHSDNAAAAAFGGFTIARRDLAFQKFEVASDLHFLLLIPDFEVRTPDARKIMPVSVSVGEAAFSGANSAWIAAAFASQDYEMLRGGFEDALHQPYRKPLVPFLDDVIHAAEEAGALGGWLSGSGSAIACLTLDAPDRVAEAMRRASPAHSRVLHTVANNLGACLVS